MFTPGVLQFPRSIQPIGSSASALLLWLACACLPGCAPDSAPKVQPNVLIIALDTLRADHLTCYEYERDTSPLLAAYSDDCVIFEGAQSCAPWTAPSLISLMTSLHPDAHGVSDNKDLANLPEQVDTLADLLQRRGYATGGFTEGGYAKGSFGLGQGFDTYPANEGDAVSYSSHRDSPSRLGANLDRMLVWLEERPAEQPFFGFFQTYEIHAPFRAPESFVQRYRPDYDEAQEHADCAVAIENWNTGKNPSIGEMRLFQRHLLHCSFAGMAHVERVKEWLEYGAVNGVELARHKMGEDPVQVDWVTDLYDAEIEFTDQELQRLWDALIKNGQRDNTLVLIVSDHGEGLGQHGKLEHGTVLHEELLNVVFMLHIPFGEFEAGRIAYPARTIDALPTILELLDIGTGKTPLQGQSLVEVLRGNRPTPPPSFAHMNAWGANAHSVLDGDWRYIVDHVTGSQTLFNLAQDPGELHNQMDEHPDTAQRLATLLTQQQIVDAKLLQRLNPNRERANSTPGMQRDLQTLGYAGMEEKTDESH